MLGTCGTVKAQDRRDEAKPQQEEPKQDEAKPARPQEEPKAAKPGPEQETPKAEEGKPEARNDKQDKQDEKRNNEMKPAQDQNRPCRIIIIMIGPCRTAATIEADSGGGFRRINFGRILGGSTRSGCGRRWCRASRGFNMAVIGSRWRIRGRETGLMDDCYIDYIDGEYVLIDLRHPGVEIPLVVVVE